MQLVIISFVRLDVDYFCCKTKTAAVVKCRRFFYYKNSVYIRCMKSQILAFMLAIGVAFIFVGTIPAGAQSQAPPKDSIVIESKPNSEPVFKGNEQTTVDSLKAVEKAVTDDEIKDLVGTAVKAIESKPPAGSSTGEYVSWGVSTLLVLALGFLGMRKKLTKPPANK